jgi:hypothetical protein
VTRFLQGASHKEMLAFSKPNRGSLQRNATCNRSLWRVVITPRLYSARASAAAFCRGDEFFIPRTGTPADFASR